MTESQITLVTLEGADPGAGEGEGEGDDGGGGDGFVVLGDSEGEAGAGVVFAGGGSGAMGLSCVVSFFISATLGSAAGVVCWADRTLTHANKKNREEINNIDKIDLKTALLGRVQNFLPIAFLFPV